jgi:superoxide dismutase
LEPHIDVKTMEIHHDKHSPSLYHHANNALKDYRQLAAKPVDELIADLRAVPEAIRYFNVRQFRPIQREVSGCGRGPIRQRLGLVGD